MQVELGERVVLTVEQIKPYWRNPRQISAEAVSKVAASIQRFGYQQPIVVDRENVIIVGHTRFEAVKTLGWDSVPVLVTDLTDELARQYRLVDNRAGELADWDQGLLKIELREFPSDIVEDYFPNLDLEVGRATVEPDVTEDQIRGAEEKVRRVAEADPKATHTTTVVCPSCFHGFPVRTRSLPGLTHADMDALTDGAAEE